MASKAVTLPVPDVGPAQKALSKALGEFAQVETAALVGGVLAVPLAEKAAYTSLREIFGNSGKGLSNNERLARIKSRFLWVSLPRPRAGPCPGSAETPSLERYPLRG